MINIFDALRKAEGEIADILPEVLEGAPLPERNAQLHKGRAAPVTQQATDEVLLKEILGESENGEPIRGVPQAVIGPRRSAIREVPLHVSASAPLLPYDDTNRAAAEQYRLIRTRLIQHPRQPRMVLVSSGGPGDGKSVTAVNIAGALSLKTEANVLLMDVDFRRPTIHKQLGLGASPGLSDVLSGTATLEEALVRTVQFPNLYVIPAGIQRGNSSELLDSTRWTAICHHLRSEFRYMIADAPPVASVADYELLQAACDGVVVVARPDHTRRDQCLKALEVIPKEKLIGVVINCIPDWFLGRMGLHGGYYYGIYGTYEGKDR